MPPASRRSPPPRQPSPAGGPFRDSPDAGRPRPGATVRPWLATASGSTVPRSRSRSWPSPWACSCRWWRGWTRACGSSVDETAGRLYVESVEPLSPAENYGIQTGMVAVSVNGVQVIRLPQLVYPEVGADVTADPVTGEIPLPVADGRSAGARSTSSTGIDQLRAIADQPVRTLEVMNPGDLASYNPDRAPTSRGSATTGGTACWRRCSRWCSGSRSCSAWRGGSCPAGRASGSGTWRSPSRSRRPLRSCWTRCATSGIRPRSRSSPSCSRRRCCRWRSRWWSGSTGSRTAGSSWPGSPSARSGRWSPASGARSGGGIPMSTSRPAC